MGTPEFAVASLRVLIENNYDIVGVITSPDRQAGRGKKIRFSAVKDFALENNLKILQPTNLKNETFLKELKSLQADLQVVVAFRMLPEVVWNMPKFGTINLHASLLPQYRGAAPINWAIINGEKETGITTFFINENIDTGNIIFQKKISINKNETAETLHDKLMLNGAELLNETVNAIQNSTFKKIEQKELIKNIALKKAPKIFKDDCKINWKTNTNTLDYFIRGLSPYPCAWSVLRDEKNNKALQTKIFFSNPITENHTQKIGSIITDNKNYLKVAVKNGFMEITHLQIQGKKKLPIKDFLRGFNAENMTF